jgi:hypothetical protein
VEGYLKPHSKNNNDDPFDIADWQHIIDAIEAKKALARKTGCGCCVAGNKLRVYCKMHEPQIREEDMECLFFGKGDGSGDSAEGPVNGIDKL